MHGVAVGAPRAVLTALLAGAGFVLLSLRGYGLLPNDEGWLLHPALRMLDGEILYRDVWVHYAPLRYHLLEGLFSLTGPSLLAARTLLIALLLATVAGLFRLALRFAPLWLAWLPAALYAVVPGPWHKAPYALCVVAFLLAAARALERPDASRFAWLGAAVGLSLVTRHELGLAQVAMAAFVVGFAVRRSAGPSAAVAAGMTLAAAAAPVLAFGAYYGGHGALGDLGEALFVRAFAQVEGGSSAHLERLLSPASFGRAIEGRPAGVALLAPLVVYPAFALSLLLRRRLDATAVLGGLILISGLAALPQALAPPLIARFLQSAAPFYLVCTWLAADGARASRGAAIACTASLAAAAGALVWLVVAGLPAVEPSDAYTGSLRMRRGETPVRVLGEEVRTDWRTAEEIRLVRAFVEAHTDPGEPVFTAPWLSLYYVLLERPNPTRYLFERMSGGDFAMSGAMKEAEMARLLSSDARYAVVVSRWWLRPAGGDTVRRTLRRHFAPVRDYAGVLVLERTDDPERHALSEIHARARRGRSTPADVAALERIAAAFPRDPLATWLLGELRMGMQRDDEGRAMLERAALLDPANPLPLERLAVWHLQAGRHPKARALVERAAAVRESPLLDALRRALAKPAPSTP